MKKTLLMTIIAALGLACVALPALAVEPFLVKESVGDSPGGAPVPCVATANINGNCANYRWYNFCSGYIWIFTAWAAGDEVGTSFKASEGMPCITQNNVVKRAINYFRNTVPNYNQLVDVILARDTNSNSCPDGADIASNLNLDPALRWNCSNFNQVLPVGTGSVIVTQRHHGGTGPSFATDGAMGAGPGHQISCPLPIPHSYYYGVGRSVCLGWVGPLSTYDNWPIWLVIDGGTATQNTSWGQIKGLYQ